MSLFALQNAFHDQLTRYVNGGCFSRADKARLLVSPSSGFRRNARDVVTSFNQFQRSLTTTDGEPVEIEVAPYEGANQHVLEMKQQLEERLADALVGAYVHGSMGSGEEVSYSDFDALVILKDEVLGDASYLVDVATNLFRISGIMLRFDPLQHHGWFVLTQSDLRQYADAYFPHVLFDHAKSIGPATGEGLRLAVRDSSEEQRRQFARLASTVEATIREKSISRNAYLLKGLLSSIMLLPALYVQVRDGKGLFKKQSFESARKDFDNWDTMDVVSELRDAWSVSFSAMQRSVLSHPRSLVLHAGRYIAPSVPVSISGKLTSEWGESMCRLIAAMRVQLGITTS